MVHPGKGRASAPAGAWICPIVLTRGSQDPHRVRISRGSRGSAVTHSVFSENLENTTTTNKEAQLYQKLKGCISTTCQTSFNPSGTSWLPAGSRPVLSLCRELVVHQRLPLCLTLTRCLLMPLNRYFTSPGVAPTWTASPFRAKSHWSSLSSLGRWVRETLKPKVGELSEWNVHMGRC